MGKSKYVLLITALLASAVLSSSVLAEDAKPWSFTTGVRTINFDNDRNLDDANAADIGIGYSITPNWSVEGVYTGFDTAVEDTSIDVDGENYRLDALYNFNPESDWQTFAVMGVGRVDYDVHGFNDSDEEQYNLGFGIQRVLSNAWRLRADARAFHGTDNDDTDFGASIGFSYLFGKTSKKSAPVAAPVDSDNDGVYDNTDECPNTAAGIKVDAKGCGIVLTESVSITLKVNFDTDSSVVKPVYFSEVESVATFMSQYENTVVTVEGHTDDRGADSYNQALSQRRADAVRQLLISNYNIAAERVTAVGYGEARPIADNNTADGRLSNRRVVAEIASQVKRNETK